MGRRFGPDVCEAIPSRPRRRREALSRRRRIGSRLCGPMHTRRRSAPARSWRERLRLRRPGAAQARPRGGPAAPAAAPAAAAAEAKKDRLLVEAKQLVYNRDTNVVSADGNVQLYYQGRVLEADKVIYDRNANRVFATGHAKLTEADGTATYSDKFELTDDFKTGFVDSLSTITKDKTFFTSPRAERSEGETTTFEKGTYTACAPCAAHPERPPLWQVKAMKIVHKTDEQMIYFEDATLELYGVPIAYVPYFSTPDPTVTRKTGFLTPHYVTESRLGVGAAQPFFWNLAPNYDLTLTPTVLSQQGFFGEVEWRHRLDTGSYSVLATGIDQLDPGAYAKQPYGTGDRDFRGSIESNGKFFINPSWKYGWDVALFSRQVLRPGLQRQVVEPRHRLHQGVDLDRLPDGPGRPQLLQPAGLPHRRPVVVRLQQAAAARAADGRLQPHLRARPGQTAGIGGEVKVDSNITSLTPDRRRLPGDRHAPARLRLLALRRVPDHDRQHAGAGLQAAVLLPARHRGRLHARLDQRQLPEQVHRPDRRGLEALRLRAGRRPLPEPQRVGRLHVHQRRRASRRSRTPTRRTSSARTTRT